MSVYITGAKGSARSIRTAALENASDIVVGAAALVQAVANTELSPAEAADISKLLENLGRAIELTEDDEPVDD